MAIAINTANDTVKGKFSGAPKKYNMFYFNLNIPISYS
jgi:hypothetical protein